MGYRGVRMKERFLALDSFRGLFALSVVMYHMHVFGSFTELKFFRGSSLFVDFFFVLSGFVITHGYAYRDNMSFSSFAISRSFRLFPLHIFMLFVFITIEIGKVFAYKNGYVFNNESFTGPMAVSQILPNLLLIQSWISIADSLSFNYPSWSISIEYYMYMIFFFTLILTKKYRIVLWSIISLGMFCLVLTNSVFPANEVKSGLFCFFSGSLTYVMFKNIKYIRPNLILSSIAEVICLVFVYFVVSSEFEYKGVIAIILFSLTILVYSFEGGFLSLVLKQPPFKRLGELSYSIYMTHAAVLFLIISAMLILQKTTGINFTQMIEKERTMNIGNEVANNILSLGILSLVVCISTLTHKYIEKTGQSLGRKLITKETR